LPEFDESLTNPAFDQTDEARAQLLEAGEALRNWAHARRATWTDRPLVPASPQRREGGPKLAPARAPAPAAPARAEFSFEDTRVASVPPEDTSPARPRKALKVAIPESVIRLSRRLAIAAVIVAMVGGAGWMTRGRWPAWSAALKNMTAPSESAPSAAETPAETQAAVPAPASPAAARGSLEVRSNPEGARVIVDRQLRGTAPLTIDNLPPGKHTVLLESADGSIERSVQITAGETALVDEAIFSGWLNVFSPIELEISEGERAILLNDESAALMAPGPHTLRFANPRLAYSVTRRVVIKPGETSAISIVPDLSSLTVTANSPAEVFVDGERAGESPLSDHPVTLGTHEIAVRTETGIERRFTITVGATPSRLDVDFSKP
jgi:hypothetical protein